MASQRLHCGVIEPIMLDIVTTQSTGESLQSPYQPCSGTEELMGTKLERIADISAHMPRPEFTSLYHLIDAEMLKQCHKELDGSKAVGIDEVTKEE